MRRWTRNALVALTSRLFGRRSLGAGGSVVLVTAVLLVPALVVTEQPARAFVPAPLLPLAADAWVISDGAAVGGELLAASGVCGPAMLVCAGTAAAAALGVVAYATRDSWLPYITGSLGASDSASGTASAYAYNGSTSPCFTASFVTPPDVASGIAPVVRVINSCPTSRSVQWADDYSCKNLSSGAFMHSQLLGGANSVAPGGSADVSVGVCGAGMGSVSHHFYSRQVSGYEHSTDLYWDNGGGPSTVNVSTTAHCVNVVTAATSDVTVTSTGDRGLPAPSCSAHLGADWHAKGFDVAGSVGGSNAQTLGSLTQDGGYPGCVGAAVCQLAVYFQGTSCLSQIGADGCARWSRIILTRPGDYSCKYGPYSVGISKCSVLERAYVTGGVNLSDPGNSDGDPATPASDPVPTTSPSGTASPTPTPGGLPSTGTNPDPTATSTVPGAPAPDSTDTAGGSCIGSAWTWNPFSWVYVPIKCALRWAFVPRTSVIQADISSTRDSWNGSAIGSTVGTVTGLVGGIGSGWSGGCTGSIADFTPSWGPGWDLTIPCTPTISGVSVARTLLGVGFAITALITIWKRLKSAIGTSGAEG